MPSKSKYYCAGCRDDFYNYPNPVSSSDECWKLEDSELWKCKPVGINDRPPWTATQGELKPKCYHRDGYVYVAPERKC